MVQNLNIYKLVVLGFILILSASTVVLAFASARSEAVTRQRSNNADKIAEALQIYFDQNGYYPVSLSGRPKEIESYLDFYPSDSKCKYVYERLSGGNDFRLTPCAL